jgi:hypothetical protein
VRAADEGEDQESIGLLIAFGKFRFIHMGDLSWERLYALFCPRNMVGPVDAYLLTHHGSRFVKSDEFSDFYWRRSACLEAEVAGLRPVVGIQSSGYTAGRDGLEGPRILRKLVPDVDLWQTQYIKPLPGSENLTPPEQFVAGLDTRNDGLMYIKLEASRDGSMVMTNSRNGYTKKYPPRAK